MIVDRRFRWLTSKQREIGNLAKEKGFVTLGEIKMFYSSKDNWNRAIKKLIDFSILIPLKNPNSDNIVFTKFKYNPQKGELRNQKTLNFLEKLK